MKRLFLMMMLATAFLFVSCDDSDVIGDDSEDVTVDGDDNDDDDDDDDSDDSNDGSNDGDGSDNYETYLVQQMEYYRNDGSDMKQVIKLEYDDQDRIEKFIVERWYFFTDGSSDIYRSTTSSLFTYTSDTRIDFEYYSDDADTAENDSEPYYTGYYTLEDGMVIALDMVCTDNVAYDNYDTRTVGYTYNSDNYLTSMIDKWQGEDASYSLECSATYTDGSCSAVASTYSRKEESGDEASGTITTTLNYGDVINLANLDLNVYIGASAGLGSLFEDLLMLGNYTTAAMSSDYLLSSSSEVENSDDGTYTYSYTYSYEFDDNGAPTSVELTREGSTNTYNYVISYVE